MTADQAMPADQSGPARADIAAAGLLAGWRERAALGLILALAAGLNFFRLAAEGYANLYYAATVRSMLSSWHNFFFASYDPGGFVTVDKPPLGFWIQAASARLLGFSGWSLLLPQALAGVLAVWALYRLVRRSFGAHAGLLAGLALAVSPISVATNRNNTIDSLLVLAVLLAAWAVLIAAEQERPGRALRWLLLGMVLVGLGFNIKMLQAYLVVPALFAAYALAPRLGWKTKLGHLALAAVALLGVSLSWALLVDLTPPERRPYVGGSSDNSELNLIFGYNGIRRLLGMEPGGMIAPAPAPAAPAGNLQPAPPALPPIGCPGGSPGAPQPCVMAIGGPSGENGAAGPLRLLNTQLAGQIGWLLPLAFLGLALGLWRAEGSVIALRERRLAIGDEHRAVALWGAWLITQVVFFSIADFYHRYYLVMVAPAIAALSAIGVRALWRAYRRPGWDGWLLPAALVLMALLHWHILRDYVEWQARLAPAILGGAALAALGLAALRHRRPAGLLPGALLAAGVAALLAAPTAWAAITVANAPGDILPGAGPDDGGLPGAIRMTAGGNPPGTAPPPGQPLPGAGNPAGGALSPGQPVIRPFPGGAAAPGQPPQGPRLRVMAPRSEADPRLLAFLREQRGDARFLAATMNAASASPIIIATGEPVMALGGFGGDRILSQEQLAAKVAAGEVRFFLLPGDEGPPAGEGGPGRVRLGPGGPGNDEILSWVARQCAQVPAERWQTPRPAGGDQGAPNPPGAEALYDCGSQRR